MGRPRLATTILGGCTGCHVALLDAHEQLLELLEAAELVHSPLTPGDTIPDCDVILVEGAVANERDRATVADARERAKLVIAMGSCAVLGGIGGLRNLHEVDDVLTTAFAKDDVGDTAGPSQNGHGDVVPRLAKTVAPVSAYVKVDYEVPGCSPPTDTIVEAIQAAIEGEPLELPRHNLCHECTRMHEKMLAPSREFLDDAVRSVMELDEIESDMCFLEQGVVCMGPVTRVGCGARCVSSNVPCRGCMGSSRPDFEQGAKAIDVLGALLPAGGLMFMDDLIGTAYRYTTAVSLFPEALRSGGDDDE